MLGFIVAVDKPILLPNNCEKTNTGGVQRCGTFDESVDIPLNKILNSRVTNAFAAEKPVLSGEELMS